MRLGQPAFFVKTPAMASATRTYSLPQILLGGWALLGVTLLLGRALVRLIPIAWEPIQNGSLSPLHWFLYASWVALNGYTEGHRGFERRFVPRVLGRVVYLMKYPTALRVALAPFFVMGYFDAKRRAIISAWSVSLAVLFAVIFVRKIPQPWRGIVDAGVVAGLGYGFAMLLLYAYRLSRGTFTPPDPEVPSKEATTEEPEEPSPLHRGALPPV